MLGTPASIQQTGAVYVYKHKFFHPDLDVWRDLIVTFATTRDESAITFGGSGGDAKTYDLEVPIVPLVAGAGPSTPTSTAPGAPLMSGSAVGTQPASATSTSPGSSPQSIASATSKPTEVAHVMEDVRARLAPSIVIIKYSEMPVRSGRSGPLIDEGSGATGVLVQHQGRKYVLTNIHVLENEASIEIQEAWINGPRDVRGGARVPQQSRVRIGSFDNFLRVVTSFPFPKMETVDGTAIKLMPDMLLSETRDLALIPAETSAPALVLAESPAQVGAKVIVAGNSDAAHMIVFREGTISQQGADRFDVSLSSKDSNGQPQETTLQPGMSGSAVVDLQTGSVAGIISYRVQRPDTWLRDEVVNSPQGATVIRHYMVNVSNVAYRVDNATDYQPVTWAQFLQDYTIYWAMRERAYNVLVASLAVETTVGRQSRQELSPDFDNSVQIRYASFCRDLERILKSSDPSYVMNKWNSYSRTLESILKEPKDRLISTAYIRRNLAPVASNTTAQVLESLRQAAGKIQTQRPQR